MDFFSGLNLRNLVWHGFPSPGEISPALVSSLIVLMFSIGEGLISNKYEVIETRPTLDLLGAYIVVKFGSIFMLVPYKFNIQSEK